MKQQKRMRSETKWKEANKVHIIKQVTSVCVWKIFLIQVEDFEDYCKKYVSVFSHTKSKARDSYPTMDTVIHLLSI